ncbi:GGDEF domain-containing protein [Rhizobium glycinendophyticum]|uniref:diguanylate cyclase n=1 Tax=Rhizobium glycinendophyticum TaxID=2589807 RepID=A0A504UCH2_9HYPH|nr:GGDEF domain-containing protein [Rhizobium glycinendophyticum]TPP11387.1 GGDEF domain-containing protein [Rhizobium glycinendophyticum]
MPDRTPPPLLKTLATPMIGADDKERLPPWEQLTELYRIDPHIIAAAALLAAAILPYLEGNRGKVMAVAVVLAVQLLIRLIADTMFRRRVPDAAFKPWLFGFILVSLLSGIAWGLSLAILYLGSGPQAQVVVLAVGCGIVQSCAARAYMAPASTALVILIMIGIVNVAALSEGDWLMIPICLAYVAFQASYMTRLVELEQARQAAEQKTGKLVIELAESNEKLRQANEQLVRHASTDGLTGLANRRSFDNRLQAEVEEAHSLGSLSLLLLDVDHFKRFNDTYGHLAGDECLRRVASMLRDECAVHSHYPARYGGEEFAVILPKADHKEAEAFATGLLSKVSMLDLSGIAEPSDPLTISIGLACLEDGDDGAHALISRADQGLYAAKQAGRNCARTVERMQDVT